MPTTTRTSSSSCRRWSSSRRRSMRCWTPSTAPSRRWAPPSAWCALSTNRPTGTSETARMDASAFSEPTRRWLREGQFVQLDARRIFVYERGTGKAVLLLHGFPTSCHDWRGVISILSEESRCIAFDFPGYGLSDKPAAYSYSLFQQTDVGEGSAR